MNVCILLFHYYNYSLFYNIIYQTFTLQLYEILKLIVKYSQLLEAIKNDSCYLREAWDMEGAVYSIYMYCKINR